MTGRRFRRGVRRDLTRLEHLPHVCAVRLVGSDRWESIPRDVDYLLSLDVDDPAEVTPALEALKFPEDDANGLFGTVTDIYAETADGRLWQWRWSEPAHDWVDVTDTSGG